MPGKCPLAIYRGDTYGLRVVLWNDTGKTEPADLTGVVPKAEIRTKPSGTLLATFACTIEAPNTIVLALAPTISAGLASTGAWDLQLTYDTGDVATILAGPVTVTPDVTDSAALMAARVALVS